VGSGEWGVGSGEGGEKGKGERENFPIHPSTHPPIHPSTKIIALTASAFEEQRWSILEAGCDDMVWKPFREQMLFEKLAEHLGVEYLYAQMLPAEPDDIQATDDNAIGHADLHLALQAMSAEWLESLNRAAMAVDADNLMELIDQIPSNQMNLAFQLSGFVRQFCFDEILEMIEQIKT
jgi:two-component system sensor histidine kinase/response regulator